MLNNIIGVNEAAEILGLSPGTIKNMCATGKIVSKKIGNTWIINKTKLKAPK
jgi:excisionase family DNA binding protein